MRHADGNACNIINYEPPDNDKDRDVSERHRSEQYRDFNMAPWPLLVVDHNGPKLHAADPSSELSTEQGLGVHYSIIDKVQYSTVLYQGSRLCMPPAV